MVVLIVLFFNKFLILKGMVVLKEVIFNSFTFGREWSS